MTDERYEKLMSDDTLELTPAEIKAGWHYCQDWDMLLVGPGMRALEACTCPPIDQGEIRASQ